MPDLSAIIFVPALAGSVIFGFVFALFAAHHYLTALQSTGSGSRDVVWVSEPILDHFWKVFYLAWLIGLWLGPAYLIGRAATAGSDSPWLKLAIPLAVFWLCYPVSQLSSLSGSTIWLPLHPDVFGRLAQKPGVVFGFYLVSAAALAVFGLAFKWVFLTAGQYELLFVGAPLLIASGLVYGRLIGRLAFALAFTKALLERRTKRKTDRGAEPDGGRAAAARADDEEEEPTGPGRFRQPSELPPIETPDEGPITGYDVKSDEEPVAAKRPRKRVRAEAVEPEPAKARPRPPAKPGPERSRQWTEEDEDAAPYGVNGPEVQPEERAPAEVVKPSAVEMRLLSRDDAPKPPKEVWSAQLLLFLIQAETLAVVVMLSGMCVLVGLMIRIARSFNPVAGGG
jgi:hypothetical protein